MKYFSGTATYRTTVNVETSLLGEGKRVELNLGDVRDLVTVRVNGAKTQAVSTPAAVAPR